MMKPANYQISRPAIKMENTTRRLLRALNPNRRRGSESALLPFITGKRFDTTAIAVDAAELVEKLCYERFYGCVYFQHESPENGAEHGVVAIADNAIAGALWVVGGAQTTGVAAWETLRTLSFLPECMAIEVSEPLVEAYATLLSGQTMASNPADARSIGDGIESFARNKSTGVLRVSDESRHLFEFWYGGMALGLYESAQGTAQLDRLSEDWAQLELGRRARLDIWHNRGERVWVSPLPFSGAETRALCELLSGVYDLAHALAPPAQAQECWQTVCRVYSALGLDALDMNAPKRARELESALKRCELAGTEIVSQIRALCDEFLEEWARAIGPKLFATRAAHAFSGAQKRLFADLDLRLETIDLAFDDDDIADNSDARARLTKAVDALRFKAAPRRNLARASSFDF